MTTQTTDPVQEDNLSALLFSILLKSLLGSIIRPRKSAEVIEYVDELVLYGSKRF